MANNISAHGQEDDDGGWQQYANFVDSLTSYLAKCPPTTDLVAQLESRLKSSPSVTDRSAELNSILVELEKNDAFKQVITAFFDEMFPLSLIRKDFAKDNHEALKLLREGDEQFHSAQYEQAISSFSQALRWAEASLDSYSFEDGETFKDLMVNLYDKRSASFLKTNQPYECILDIEQLLAVVGSKGTVSPSTYIRLAHATASLKDFSNLAKLQSIYVLCEDFVRNKAQNCPPNLIERMTGYLNKISEMIVNLGGKAGSSISIDDDPELSTLGAKLEQFNLKIAGASSKVDIQHSAQKGRHFVATQPIADGEVLFVEKPFAIYTQSELHCGNCLRRLGNVKELSQDGDKPESTDVDECSIEYYSFVPCNTCSKFIFCDQKCHDQACSRFHAAECGKKMFALENHLGIAYIVLRTILTAGGPAQALQQFQSQQFPPQENYLDEYQTLLSLLSHSSEHDSSSLVSYLLTSTFLLHCLGQFGIEHSTVQDNSLLLLLMHHLQQMSTNLVTIFEQDVVGSGGGTAALSAMSLPSKEEPIGVGFYPIIALLNHSCDPDLIPIFLGSKLVLKATRAIKPNSEICFCYGPTYLKMIRSKRQKMLSDNYFFTCQCSACVQGKENYNEAYLCITCNGPAFLETDNRLVCSRAGHVNTEVTPVLDAVKQARDQLAAGENFLEQYKQREDSADVIAALVSIHKADVTCSEHLFALNSLLIKTKREMLNCYLKMGHLDRAEIYSRQLIKVFYKYLNDELQMPLLQEQLRLVKILFLRAEELSETEELKEICQFIKAALVDFESGLKYFEQKHGKKEFSTMFAKEIDFVSEKWELMAQLVMTHNAL